MIDKNIWQYDGVQFQAGDKVRVMRQVDSHDPDGMGEGKPWINNWLDEMDIYLGLEFTIQYIDNEGAVFQTDDEDCGMFGVPLKALVKM